MSEKAVHLKQYVMVESWIPLLGVVMVLPGGNVWCLAHHDFEFSEIVCWHYNFDVEFISSGRSGYRHWIG